MNIDFSEYKYGRFNLAENNFEFIETPEKITILNFYNGPSNQGTCDELSEHLFTNPQGNGNFYRARGKEPLYYFQEKSVHCFLIETKDPLPSDFWTFPLAEKTEYLQSQDSQIIDPSFKKNIQLSKSRYEITSILNRPYNINKNQTFSKKNHNLNPPLGITKNKELIQLGIEKEKLVVSLITPHHTTKDKFYLDNLFAINRLMLREKLQEPLLNFSRKYIAHRKEQ